MPQPKKTLSKKKTVAKSTNRLATTRTTAKKKRPSSRSKTAKQPKGLVHHTKRLFRATPKFIHGMVVGAFIGILVVAQLHANLNASALAIPAGKDCDSYSIINCGVTSTADLKNTYANLPYVQHVYKHFGISAADVDGMGQTAVQGTVYSNGQVKAFGRVVATGAITAARLRVTGQDKQVTVDGSTFFTRPLSISWSHDSAQAYVVMKNGVFQYAILAPCGNPIVASPVSPPPPPPPPTTPPPTPQPTPSLVCDSLGRNNNGLTYTFVARATAKHTTIKSYSFYLSDRSKPLVVKSSATQVSLQHTFPSNSTKYSVYVIVASDGITTRKSDACSKNFVTPSVTECKPGIPNGSPDCTTCDQNLASDNACAPPPTVPIVETASVSTLANTGPGAVLIIFAISLVCGTLFHKTHHHIKKRRHARRHAQTHHAQ